MLPAGGAIRARLATFSPQQLANTSWAVAKLLERASPQTRDVLDFWALLAPEVERRAMALNAQELSMCCWAAAQAVGSWVGSERPAQF